MRHIAFIALLALAAHAQAASQSWSFRVFLDGRDIGRHTFVREEAGEGARVVSEARFEVRFLFLTAYRYEHRAEEQWRGRCLASLDARTDDNGAEKVVRVRPTGCIQSFAYWDPAILTADRLLNAQTGEVVPVRASDLGAQDGAHRYRLTGPGLSIDLWYAGRDWVALESSVEGGRRLRYERL